MITGTNTFDSNLTQYPYLRSKGAITTNNVTASYNLNGMSALLQNRAATAGVTMTGAISAAAGR